MACEEVSVTRHNRDAMSETSLPDRGGPVRGGDDERSVPGAGDWTAWPVCTGLSCRACQAGLRKLERGQPAEAGGTPQPLDDDGGPVGRGAGPGRDRALRRSP